MRIVTTSWCHTAMRMAAAITSIFFSPAKSKSYENMIAE